MTVLLSIKPQFADKIFAGEKLYEFRRSIFKDPNVKKVVVYASAPVQKVIGEFDIETILHEEVSMLWKKTRQHSGITEAYFNEYFEGKEKGFAIKIKRTRKYRIPKCIRKDFNAFPPQSFIYI